jgi:hypothetical protein
MKARFASIALAFQSLAALALTSSTNAILMPTSRRRLPNSCKQPMAFLSKHYLFLSTCDNSPWINLSSSSENERDIVVQQILKESMGAGSFNIVGHNFTTNHLNRLEQSARYSSLRIPKLRCSAAHLGAAKQTTSQCNKNMKHPFTIQRRYGKEGLA